MIKNHNLEGRVFLMLQGPQSNFFLKLAHAIARSSGKSIKVNLCGGDVLLWRRLGDVKGATTLSYNGKVSSFPLYIASLYDKYKVTDLVLYSDWRPMHQDAILIAKNKNIRVWVYEEGYLRQGYVTLERSGVNGRSSIPKTKEEILKRAKHIISHNDVGAKVEPTMRRKVLYAIEHHFGNVILFPFFYHYRTHREHNILFELIGILPRYLKRKTRIKKSFDTLDAFFKDKREYYLYPLQLNTDSQVQLYSPYIRQEETISHVITSFAKFAPKNTRLLIKNHPLDNGLIHYADFIYSMAKVMGVEGRVTFVEDGNTSDLIEKAKALVLINSTVGLSALVKHKRVYCLGYSVYSIKGLADSYLTMSLDDFWQDTKEIDLNVLESYLKVLTHDALIKGDFYSKQAVNVAVINSIRRFEKA